jgi:DNA-binding response OmpR family regulator
MARIPVLVVEDDAEDCSLYALELRLQGFEVRTANDGLTALRILETFQAAVIVLDLRMPFADGFDVLQELRAIPPAPGTVVIVISGDENGVSIAREDPAVCAAFKKPFLIADLVRTIMRALRISDESALS